MFSNHFLAAWPMISEEQDQRFNRCMQLSLRAEDFLLPEHPENFTTELANSANSAKAVTTLTPILKEHCKVVTSDFGVLAGHDGEFQG